MSVLKKIIYKDKSGTETTVEVGAEAENIDTSFTEVSTRTNIASGEKLSVILGKIKKWFTDLHKVAFSGNYTDLSNKPESLKNPNSLIIRQNSTSGGTSYDGSSEATVNITPSGIKAAPTSHAVSATTYGAGSGSNYGHVKLSDSTSSSSGTNGGTAATPAAVKTAMDRADSAYDLANGKANASHTHNISDVTNLQSTLDGKFDKSGGEITGDVRLKGSSNYGRKLNFGDGDYVHLYEDTDDHLTIKGDKGVDINTGGSYNVKVNGQAVLTGAHTHSISDITNLQTQLNGKLASDAYSGKDSSSFIAQKFYNSATGSLSFAAGSSNIAKGTISFVCGYSNTALDYQTKCGHGAKDGTAGDNSGMEGDAFTIGNGTVTRQSNAFRVEYSGKVYGTNAFNSTGADYAEFFEWLDGNPEDVDRRGLFVTLDGDKIRLANADDGYILGAISGAPGVVGNNHADMWKDMWKRDVFGRVLTHTVHHDAEYDDEGNLIHDACDAVEPIVNPDYNPDEKYIPREERKEWGIVGMMGQLVVIDDGTCKVNGNCTVSDGGTATASDSGYRVIARLDDTHVKVLFR